MTAPGKAEIFVQEFLHGAWKGTQEQVNALESEVWEKWVLMMTCVEAAEDVSHEDESRAISEAYHVLLVNAFKLTCAFDKDKALYMELSQSDQQGMSFFRSKKGNALKFIFDIEPYMPFTQIGQIFEPFFLYQGESFSSAYYTPMYAARASNMLLKGYNAAFPFCPVNGRMDILPYSTRCANLERQCRRRWLQYRNQSPSSAGGDTSGSSKGNRLLVTKIRELTKQVSEGKGMIEHLEQRIQQLETAPMVAIATEATTTATVCGASVSRAEPTLAKQLLEMGFSQKEILAIPPGITGMEEAANYLFSK